MERIILDSRKEKSILFVITEKNISRIDGYEIGKYIYLN